MKVRDVIRLVEDDGWRLVETEGSHRQFRHPSKPGRVTVSGHPGDDMPQGNARLRTAAGGPQEREAMRRLQYLVRITLVQISFQPRSRWEGWQVEPLIA